MKRLALCVLVSLIAPRLFAATIVAVNAEHQRATLALTAEELPQVRQGARRVRLAEAAPLLPIAAPAASTPSKAAALGAAPASVGLFHPSQVNPAQIRRIDSLYAEGNISLVNDEFHMRGDATEAALSLRGPLMRAATVLTDAELGMQLGLTVQAEELTGRMRFDVADVDEDAALTISESVIGPVIGARLPPALGGQWFAALTYKVVQRRFAGPYYEASHSLTYTRVQPGVLFATPQFETGLTFEPKVVVESASIPAPGIGDATVRVADPVRLTWHGRLVRRAGVALYGSLTSNQNRLLNANGATGWQNNFLVVGGSEKQLNGGAVIDGALLLYTPAAASSGEKTVDNIARYGFHANYARAYTTAIAIQAGLLVITANDSYSDAEIGRVNLGRDTLQISGAATYEF